MVSIHVHYRRWYVCHRINKLPGEGSEQMGRDLFTLSLVVTEQVDDPKVAALLTLQRPYRSPSRRGSIRTSPLVMS